MWFTGSLFNVAAAILCGALTLALGGCAAAPRLPPAAGLGRFEYSEVHMGVRARLVLYAPSEAVAQGAARAAFARIAQLDSIMSDYRPDSELMRLCDCAGAGPQPVSAELFEVLAFAKQLFRRSHGLFDVTSGPAVQLWRTMRRTGQVAPRTAIDEALSRVGSQWMLLNPRRRTVDLLMTDMRLDLGGIAKGDACDRAAAALRAAGVDRFLVAMAGDIVVGEPPPDRDDWEIAVEGGMSASAGGDRPVLHLVNQAVSTSGDAEQFIEIDGVRYSHIVDPRTGLGSSRRIAATVVAPTGMMSDSMATALCLLPVEQGLALARSFGGTDAIIEEAAQDAVQRYQTPGMAAHLAERKKSVP